MTKYKIIVSPLAKEQLKGITAHIRDNLFAPQAAKSIALAIKSAIASLASMPERIPRIRSTSGNVSGLHRMVVKSYLIYFEIDEAAQQVNVVAVIYGKRDQANQLGDLAQS